MAVHQSLGVVQVMCGWGVASGSSLRPGGSSSSSSLRPGCLPTAGAAGSGPTAHLLPSLTPAMCRGPFSGAKLMHAHLCGRLPRDTLVAGYDPGVPAFMLTSDVSSWFRCAPAARLPGMLHWLAAAHPVRWGPRVQGCLVSPPLSLPQGRARCLPGPPAGGAARSMAARSQHACPPWWRLVHPPLQAPGSAA